RRDVQRPRVLALEQVPGPAHVRQLSDVHIRRMSQAPVLPCLQGKDASREGKSHASLRHGSDRGAGTAPRARAGRGRSRGHRHHQVGGQDRAAVIGAVRSAAPEVIVHQMTALADMRSLRRFDVVFAATNELRTKGTDNLLAAAAEAGTRRVVAQSYTGWTNERSGGPVKTESDPLDPRPLSSTRQSMAAIRHVEQAVPAGGPEGLALRSGSFSR